MEYIKIGNIWIALIITLVLILIHFITSKLHHIRFMSEKSIVSFGSGLTVAYVFLHMLPELVEGNEAIGKVMNQIDGLTPMTDLAIFIVALVGFNVYYGFELLARKASKSKHSSPLGYRLHLAIYCMYNILITYTMPLRVQTGMAFAIVFTIAMGMHFFISDISLRRHFPDYFDVKGHYILLFSLFVGWLISAVTEPVNVFYSSLLISFLSGSILFNVFKEEIPPENESSYGGFFVGSAIMAVVLILLTAIK